MLKNMLSCTHVTNIFPVKLFIQFKEFNKNNNYKNYFKFKVFKITSR